MLQFEIIRNSESKTGYNIPDKEYKGQIDGLCCGWQFEFERSGKIDYNSVNWYHGTPEECAYQYGEEDAFELERMNGWEPTGRVIFRGYAREYYDVEDREWYIQDVEV